jgi:RNA polymerase sigma factor (sigma-70 family)
VEVKIMKRGWDRQVAQDFFQATRGPLRAYVRRRVRDRWEQEEVVQAACAGAFLDPTFDAGRPDAFGFVKKRAGWLVKDHGRQQRRGPAPLPAFLTDRRAERPGDALERLEVQAAVRRAVSGLPAGYRSVLLLHLEGLDHAEAAARLRVPVKVFYLRFHRAKAALRRLLENEMALVR